VHVCTTGQRLPKETTESQILFVTCSLLLIIKERDWLKLRDEVISECEIISSHSDIIKNANSFNRYTNKRKPEEKVQL